MVYNKTLFEENGWEIPSTYAELKDLCAKIAEQGITPWFMPGADGCSISWHSSRSVVFTKKLHQDFTML